MLTSYRDHSVHAKEYVQQEIPSTASVRRSRDESPYYEEEAKDFY